MDRSSACNEKLQNHEMGSATFFRLDWLNVQGNQVRGCIYCVKRGRLENEESLNGAPSLLPDTLSGFKK